MNDVFLALSIILFWTTVGVTLTIILALLGFAIWEWWQNRKLFFPKQTDWDDPE